MYLKKEDAPGFYRAASGLRLIRAVTRVRYNQA